MPEHPDTITATGSATVEVEADRADIVVRVSGSAAWGRNEALTKAREVTALVSDLQRAGIEPDRIEVLSITTQSSGGRLARSTSATYRLRVRTDDADRIPQLLDIIAAHKDAGVEGIVWRYPRGTGRPEALQQAISDARQIAAISAAALDVQLLQVHRFTQNIFDDSPGPMPRVAMAAAMAESAGPSLDIDVVHRKTIRAQVEVTYRIG